MTKERNSDFLQLLADEGWELLEMYMPLEIGQIGNLSDSQLDHLKQQDENYDYGVMYTELSELKGMRWGLHKENRDVLDPFKRRTMYQIIRRRRIT